MEWNIGEAAGMLAAFCREKGMSPRQVRGKGMEDFQAELARQGVEYRWPESVKGAAR